MDRNDKKEFLTNFSKSYQNMIATNDGAYGSVYGSALYHRRYHRKYTPEEIENIIENGSAKVRLVNKKDLDKYENIESWRIAEDDAVSNLLLNVENNEDGYEF